LLGIQERVSQLGGRFHVESQAGSGAVASIHFPVLAAAEQVVQKGRVM